MTPRVQPDVLGREAPLGRRTDGRLAVRNPLSGLDQLRAAPGLVATLFVLSGSTAFDGASASTTGVVQAQSRSLSPDTANALGLTVTVLLAYVRFTAALRLAGRIAGDEVGGGAPALPGRFAHSLVPIAGGDVVAHYFSSLTFNGQQAVNLASDPLGDGADFFGTSGEHLDYTVVSMATIALVQVSVWSSVTSWERWLSTTARWASSRANGYWSANYPCSS